MTTLTERIGLTEAIMANFAVSNQGSMAWLNKFSGNLGSDEYLCLLSNGFRHYNIAELEDPAWRNRIYGLILAATEHRYDHLARLYSSI